MKALKKKIFLIVLLFAAFLLLWKLKAPDEKQVSLAQTSMEAADELLDAYENGQDSLLFFSPEIKEKQVYHILQAKAPYMSSLQTEIYRNGRMRLTYEIPQKEEQDKGLQTAREKGAAAVAGETTIRKKLEAIHDALIRDCVYVEETGNRGYMAAGAAEDGKAICAGYARAFQAMCDGAGIDVYYIEDDDMTHAWNAIRLYGRTYFIDCTYDDPVPDRGDIVGKKYFMITAQQLRTVQQWDEELYEQLLDESYPEDFSYIQRMQDLQLADSDLRISDTDRPAEQKELDALNALLGVTVYENLMTTEADGTERPITCGELYHMGYDMLWMFQGSERVIEKLIDARVVPVLTARNMGF